MYGSKTCKDIGFILNPYKMKITKKINYETEQDKKNKDNK